jgi:hypothetical protein
MALRASFADEEPALKKPTVGSSVNDRRRSTMRCSATAPDAPHTLAVRRTVLKHYGHLHTANSQAEIVKWFSTRRRLSNRVSGSPVGTIQ